MISQRPTKVCAGFATIFYLHLNSTELGFLGVESTEKKN